MATEPKAGRSLKVPRSDRLHPHREAVSFNDALIESSGPMEKTAALCGPPLLDRVLDECRVAIYDVRELAIR